MGLCPGAPSPVRARPLNLESKEESWHLRDTVPYLVGKEQGGYVCEFNSTSQPNRRAYDGCS